MIFQEPMTSLSPVTPSAARSSRRSAAPEVSKEEAKERAIEMLERWALACPAALDTRTSFRAGCASAP